LKFFPFELEEVVEGSTKLLVPKNRTRKGPGKRTEGFYNEGMKFNRDLAVLFLELISERESSFKVLDGLAATGAMGVRLAKEVKGLELTVNDRHPIVYELIKRNIELNNLEPENARAENRDLNALLHERRFDYIDIDPYGSPVPFLDSAFRALKRKGHIGITATDKAPLCGVYPKACYRKYLSRPIKTSYSAEIGLRILLGYCARTAAKYGLGAKPLLSYSLGHSFRIYLQVKEGAGRADETLKNMGYVCHDEKSGERFCSESVKQDHLNTGPLWTGALLDKKIVSNLKPRSHMDVKVQRFVELWEEEALAPPLFYTTDEISSLLKISPPSITRFIQELKARGFVACRTHFSPTGFKTNASIKDLEGFLRT